MVSAPTESPFSFPNRCSLSFTSGEHPRGRWQLKAVASAPILFPGDPSGQIAARWTRWAALKYPILIRGERGTGKTALAAELHRLSGREGRFVNGSFAQMQKGLELAELLGHRKGAFTGALFNRPGLLERAHGGTTFLDELGRASPEAQSALLGFLDHGRVTPIGGTQELILNTRLIAATNADIDAKAQEGLFSPDLLDRFGFYRVDLPPLRDCRDDIMRLALLFLARESRALGRVAPVIGPAVERLLLTARWRGNVRELQKLCEYVVGNAGDRLEPGDLPPAFLASVGLASTDPRAMKETIGLRARRVLAECGGNRSETARRLGISRPHLYRVLSRAPAEGQNG